MTRIVSKTIRKVPDESNVMLFCVLTKVGLYIEILLLQVLRSLAPGISSATMPIMWLDKMVVTGTYFSDVTTGKMSIPMCN